MKQLVLTGLGSVTNFKDGSASYMLVFNEGEFSLPVSDSQAQMITGFMVGGAREPGDTSSEMPLDTRAPVEPQDAPPDEFVDTEDGVNQV